MQKTETKIKQKPPNQPTKTQNNPKQTRKETNNNLISIVHGNGLITVFVPIFNQPLYRKFKSFPKRHLKFLLRFLYILFALGIRPVLFLPYCDRKVI